ncbi:MAG TPA: response regulator transcription factor [Candidatus Sulfotelmatobacter sp.]|nr:response regulator transcription factor [Candidatus Sulfotelmatobacter sp.]
MKTTTTAATTTVWLVEDHEDCRRMVARVINRTTAMRCEHAFSNCEEALSALGSGPPPDVILLDVGLPRMNGIQGIREIKGRAPSTHVVMLTVYDDHEKVFNAICAGASGYLLKTADDQAIVNAIQEVLNGGAPMNPRVARMVLGMFTRLTEPAKRDYGLSPRETQILELMSHGLIKKEIADRLALSYHTVDNHLRSIYGKLHVHTRGGAVAKALTEKLL